MKNQPKTKYVRLIYKFQHENKDNMHNDDKEDNSKKVSILEERVFGKDLKNFKDFKNITFRNKNEKEKYKAGDKNNIKIVEQILNFNILKKKDEVNFI